MKKRGLGLVGALVVMAFLGMSLASAQDATVNVELNEWSVTPDVSSVTAGDIDFVATNTGAIDHELVVLKTDLAADALPVADGKVDEHGAGVEEIGEIEEFAAGATESATFTLTPGSYVLICNIAGHYEAGMYTAFTVSADATDAADATDVDDVAAPETGSVGPLSDSEGGFLTGILVLVLAVLGATMLLAGGGWMVAGSRRTTR